MTYTIEDREKIKLLKERGASWEHIGIAVGRKANVVKQWYYQNKINFGLPEKVKITPKLTDARVGLQIKKLVKKNPLLSVRDLTSELRSSLPPSTPCPSYPTVHRFLMTNELKVIKLLKKPLISLRNQEKRVRFALDHIENVDTLVATTIWSDETTVRKAPKSQDLIYRCHSSIEKEDLPFNNQLQCGGFSVMFWGCFSIYGLGPLVALDGSQNQHTYKELLKNYVVPEIQAAKGQTGLDIVFMQDNAPCHKTKMIADFLAANRVETLDWPPSSPDINPIENLWAILKKKRQKKFGFPKSKFELIEQIFIIWDDIDQELCQKLANSVEKRLLEVIRLNGRPTKY